MGFLLDPSNRSAQGLDHTQQLPALPDSVLVPRLHEMRRLQTSPMSAETGNENPVCSVPQPLAPPVLPPHCQCRGLGAAQGWNQQTEPRAAWGRGTWAVLATPEPPKTLQ